MISPMPDLISESHYSHLQPSQLIWWMMQLMTQHEAQHVLGVYTETLAWFHGWILHLHHTLATPKMKRRARRPSHCQNAGVLENLWCTHYKWHASLMQMHQGSLPRGQTPQENQASVVTVLSLPLVLVLTGLVLQGEVMNWIPSHGTQNHWGNEFPQLPNYGSANKKWDVGDFMNMNRIWKGKREGRVCNTDLSRCGWKWMVWIEDSVSDWQDMYHEVCISFLYIQVVDSKQNER